MRPVVSAYGGDGNLGMRCLLGLLILVGSLVPAVADQSAETIARALERRLGEALLPAGDYLEMRFYEKTSAQGFDFRVNLEVRNGRIVSRWMIDDGIATERSYLFRGVGAARLYADAGFSRLLYTIGSDHLDATRISKTLVFGGVELCPGVAFFSDTRFGGDSFTQVVCDPAPGRTYCKTPARDWMRQARSLRTNRIVREVRLYASGDCRGDYRIYTAGGTGHEVGAIKLTVEDRCRFSSFSIGF